MAYNNVKVKARQVVAQTNTQTKDLGIVSVVPMDLWNATIQYQKLNKVRYILSGGGGVTLLAKKTSQGIEPFVSQGWQEVWMVENYDGKGVVSVAITYQSSESNIDIPTMTWTETIPNVPQGQYLWTKLSFNFTDGTSISSYTVSYQAVDGNAIVKTKITYQAGISGTTPPNQVWTETIPNVPQGQYLWTKTTIHFSKSEDVVSYSVSLQGLNFTQQDRDDIDRITDAIPSTASESNPLATHDFVNSSINAMAAFYITYNVAGNAFPTKASLTGATTFYSGGKIRVPTQNDYATVLSDESQTQNTDGTYPTTRYVYQGGTYPNGQWELSFIVNSTAFTQAQLDALNSGITAPFVQQIQTNKTDIVGLKQTSNKNLYNLGAYDTYVSNDNGTGIVLRKTGVREYRAEEVTQILVATSFYYCYLDKPIDFVGYGNTQNVDFKSNKFTIRNGSAPNTLISFGEDYKFIAYFAIGTTLEQARQAIDGLIIQYERTTQYQYPDLVIENQPINPANQEEERYWDEEWKKGLNLYSGSQEITDVISNYYYKDTLLYKLDKAGTYTIKYDLTPVSGEVPTTASLAWGVNSPTKEYGRFNVQTAYTFTVTPEQVGGNLFIRFGIFSTPVDSTYSVANIMLNYGSHPYPYEPYSGGIVRESDLESIDTTALTISNPNNYSHIKLSFNDGKSSWIENTPSNYGLNFITRNADGSLLRMLSLPTDDGSGVLALTKNTVSKNGDTMTGALGITALNNQWGRPIIRTEQQSEYGDKVILSSNSQTVVAAGESQAPTQDVENLFLEANENVLICTNTNGGWSNRKEFTFHTNGNFNVANGQIEEQGNRVYSPNNLPDKIYGRYTGSGGKQPPSYVGANAVKCNMMDGFEGLTTPNLTGYMDVLMMNAYTWSDVPFATAIGVGKTTNRAWIARGGNTNVWTEVAEIITSKNIAEYVTGSGLAGLTGYTVSISYEGGSYFDVRILAKEGYTPVIEDFKNSGIFRNQLFGQWVEVMDYGSSPSVRRIGRIVSMSTSTIQIRCYFTGSTTPAFEYKTMDLSDSSISKIRARYQYDIK